MKKNEKLLLGGWIMFLMWILIAVTTLNCCDGGWSVGGLDIPETESNYPEES